MTNLFLRFDARLAAAMWGAASLAAAVAFGLGALAECASAAVAELLD